MCNASVHDSPFTNGSHVTFSSPKRYAWSGVTLAPLKFEDIEKQRRFEEALLANVSAEEQEAKWEEAQKAKWEEAQKEAVSFSKPYIKCYMMMSE